MKQHGFKRPWCLEDVQLLFQKQQTAILLCEKIYDKTVSRYPRNPNFMT